MYLNWLTTFKKVIEEHNYSKAAGDLFISQSAVSQQIRQLEKFFHAQLIRRQGREIRLTEAGEAVYGLAELVESGLEATRQHVAQITHDTDLLVTVASATTPLVHLLPPVLEQFWSEYPHVSIKTIYKLGRGVADAVKTGEADIGIQSSVPLDSHLNAIPLLSDRVVVVCAPIHPLTRESKVTPEMLAKQKFAMLGSGAWSRQLLDQWFTEHSVSLGDNVLEVALIAQIRSAALENIALGILPLFTVIDDLRSGRLMEIDVDDFHLTHMLHLIRRPEVHSPAQRLIALLLESTKVQPA